MTKDKPKTPRSDALEAQRKAFGARRTPAYGDALALCRVLEAEVAELIADRPRENAFYKLGGQMDDVVPGHVLQEARPVVWCHFEQKWVE
jgi:hypothetical protein